MNDKFFDYANIFAQHIIKALDCLHEYNAMNTVFEQEENLKQFNIAPHFFLTAYHAMLFRFEIEVCKLFDENSYSFNNFKNSLIKNNIIQKNEVEKYVVAYNVARNDIKEILNKRNKLNAHSDKDVFLTPDIYAEEHSYKSSNVNRLLYEMLWICNLTIQRQTTDGIPQIKGTDNGDDFLKLFGYETEAEIEYRNFFRNLVT